MGHVFPAPPPVFCAPVDVSACSVSALSGVWLVDCGASRHCVPSVSMLSRVTDRSPTLRVQVANGQFVRVACIGDVRCSFAVRGIPVHFVLHDVIVVPGFVRPLFSCAWGFKHDGIRTDLNDVQRLVLPCGAAVPFLPSNDKYLVRLSSHGGASSRLVKRPLAAAASTTMTNEDDLTHARLAHFSLSRIRMAIDKTRGMELTNHKAADDCEACAKGGLRNQRFRKTEPGTKRVSLPVPATKLGERFTFFGQCVTTD